MDSFHPPLYDDSPFSGDIDLQPPSPTSDSHIGLYNANTTSNNTNTTGSYNNSPFSSHSELSFTGALFEDAYDPADFDQPHSRSSLLMFDDNNELTDYMPFEYRSPSPGSDNNDDSHSRASSTSSNHYQQSPHMHVTQSFEGLSFHSPSWNTDPLPQLQQQQKPPSPPRLLMPDPQPPIVINAPDDGDLSSGPRLHIVPATPISGGGAANPEVPFQTTLETLNQGASLHLGQSWLDVDKSNQSSRSPSPSHSHATTPGPSRSPSASPQPSHLSPHLPQSDLPVSFLLPDQGLPRTSRSKSDTALEPPNWNTTAAAAAAYLNIDQQQQQLKREYTPTLPATHNMQTAHPPTLGQNFTFGPPTSSSSQQTPSNNNDGMSFLSPDLSGSLQGIRRSKSDSGGRHRGSRSEDIRPGYAAGNNFDMNNGGYLFPPTAHDDFIRHQQGGTPQFLSPSMGPGLSGATTARGHGHSLSLSSHPEYSLSSGSVGISGAGGRHYRRASSGTRSERGTSVGAWEDDVNGRGNRPSPYPSPNASPRGRYGELRGGEGEFDFGVSGTQLPAQTQLQGQGVISVSKPNVTTGRTANASHKRRKQEATFVCPVPGCGSTFTRSFNLKGHIRSHNEEKPFQCHWPGCGKGFARQHDCKRHEQLHTNYRPFTCDGCNKQFARMDALNRHLRSDGGADCLRQQEANAGDPSSSTPASASSGGGASSAPSPATSATSASGHGRTYSQGGDGVTVTYSGGDYVAGPTKMEDTPWGLGVQL